MDSKIINLKRSLGDIKNSFFTINPKIYNEPLQIFLYVTQRCNSRCLTCNFWKNENIKDLSKEVIFKFIDEISTWLGPKIFTLSGIGEVLMREDIFDVIKYISSKKSYARINTNGFLLDKKTIDRLVESGMSEIVISLNGITPGTHDFSRGVEGGLNKIFEAVEYIREKYPDFFILFNMIIFKQNLDEIIPTIEYAHKVKANICFQPISSTFDLSFKTEIRKELWPDNIEKIKSILEEMKKYKKMGYSISMPDSLFQIYLEYFKNPDLNHHKNCKLGFYNLTLYNNGDVKLCDYYPSLGNIENTPIKELWKSKLAKEQRKQMKSCPMHCPPLLCYSNPNPKDFIKELYVAGNRFIARIFKKYMKIN